MNLPRNAKEAREAILIQRVSDNAKVKHCVTREELAPENRFWIGGELVVAFSKDSNGLIDGHFVAPTS